MFTFIGDAGIDFYSEQSLHLLGGCSLNVATHFKRNTSKPCTLIYPSSCENQLIETHCLREGISSSPFIRNKRLPSQEIKIQENGEKLFGPYQSEIFDQFVLEENEKLILNQLKGTIISPLYNQILPFIDQVIDQVASISFVFDFHSAEDFNKDFKKLYPYLKLSKLSFFGLNERDVTLKNQLLEYALTYKKEILITQGAQEILYCVAGKTYTYSPIPLANVTDSTGAGDSFLGVFLASDDLMPELRLQKSSTYAKNTLTHLGAFKEKSREEVES